MSSTRPAGTVQLLTGPGLAFAWRWIGLAAIATGVLVCGATLLSQGTTPTQPIDTTPMCATPRNEKAPSPSSSLAKADLRALTVEAARRQLTAATEQLADFESSVQGQLAELKSRQDDTHLTVMAQQAIATSATACYQAAARLEHERQLTQILEAAQTDPLAWSRIPADALVPYAELRQRLSELRTAQTRTAHLLETRLPAHPAVRSARAAEQELAESLQQELAEIMPQRHAALKADEQQLTSLRDQLQRQEARERQLAGLVAEHDRYLGNVRTCEAVLGQAEQTHVATLDTDDVQHVAAPEIDNTEIDNVGSLPASTANTALASHEPVSRPATSSPLVRGNRTLLILVGMFGGLFACMGYFYLTGSRRVDSSIAQASCAGHCAPPFDLNADSSPAAMRSNQLETSGVAVATPSLNEPPHSTVSPLGARSTSPTPATTSVPPRSVTRDPLGLRPTGRMTLRDALVRCAERANRP